MAFIMIWLMAMVSSSVAEDKVLKMATTTSPENSGLLDVLIPEFVKDTGIRVKVFAEGTGAAIRDGQDGNVGIIFVHAKDREERFVTEGYGAYRLAVMHNDFVIAGPASDLAGVREKARGDAAAALRAIADARVPFVSRGDDSGTHTKEQELWKATRLGLRTQEKVIVKKGRKATISFLHPEGLGEWYLSIGQGMGKSLTYAEEKRAYILTDRGTYLKYKFGREHSLCLAILCEGDEKLHNPYGIIPIDPKRHPHVNYDMEDRFAKWLVSPRVQAMIRHYKVHGHQAFFPDAIPDAK